MVEVWHEETLAMPADAAEMLAADDGGDALLAAGCYELDEAAAVRRGAVRLYSVRPGGAGGGGSVRLESAGPEAPGPSGGAGVSGVFDLRWKRRGPGRAPLLAHAAADGTATVYEAVRAGGARALRTVASVRCADGAKVSSRDGRNAGGR